MLGEHVFRTVKYSKRELRELRAMASKQVRNEPPQDSHPGGGDNNRLLNRIDIIPEREFRLHVQRTLEHFYKIVENIPDFS